MKIVCAAGQLANGKDILCDYLMEKLNSLTSIEWERSAFADPVKNIYCNAFGVDRAFIEKWKRIPEAPPGFFKPVRQGLQFIGDGFRNIKANVWVEMPLRDESKNLIISDSRYLNEARHVRAKDGIMVVVYRPGFLNDDPNPSESQIKPIVEWCLYTEQEDGPIDCSKQSPMMAKPEDIYNYNFFLTNNGSIEEFHEKIDQLLIPYILNKYEIN